MKEIINKVCCIFNVAPHYNAPIYRLIDKYIICDFYLGDRIHLPINLMNYNDLVGFKYKLKYIPLFSNFYWQKGAIDVFFKNYKIILLTGEVYCLSNWIILIMSLFSKKKIFLWSHGWYGDESLAKTVIKKLYFKMASKTFLYGNYAKKLMIENGFDEHKLVCIYNSMDYDLQLKVRKSLVKTDVFVTKFNNNNPTLIFVGRIQKSKRIDLILNSLYELKLEGISYNLVLVGEEAEFTGVEELISQLNLNGQVWLFGSCFDENILGELFYNSDLCVSPGSVGLTAVHSLMYGTPVISHDNFAKQGPEFEVIDGINTGCFFKENDHVDLKNKINDWIVNKKNNRDCIRELSFEIIDKIYNPYNQIEILKEHLMR